MKLLTKELEARFAQVGRQEDVKDPLIIAKYFSPVGAYTFYATEYYPDEGTFYGYVTGLYEDEWGYTSLSEMESVQLPFGLKIERDLYFGERPFSSLKK